MDALRFENADLDLIVRCNGLATSFAKAKSRQPGIETATSYSVPSGSFSIYDYVSDGLIEVGADSCAPVFFENKDYFVGVRFKEKNRITKPSIYSRLREVQDKFQHESSLGYLSGTINYGNDIGRSELMVRYFKDEEQLECILGFEVFPTKLDYRNDFNKIVDDIERVYPQLVLDFLKRTYSSFKIGDSQKSDLIWWQVFGGLYKELIKAANFILAKPHSRLQKEIRFVTADRVRHWTKSNEERFAEFRALPETKYITEYKKLTTDTIENRFLKHAMTQTSARYRKLKQYVSKKFGDTISADFRAELEEIELTLSSIVANPMFRTISPFKGLRQESLVLQRATGYATVYRCWLMLNSGLRFLEGIQRIELKNIAELYQIWCFLEMKRVLELLLQKQGPDEVNIAKIRIDNFVATMDRGIKSEVAFIAGNGDRVELYHDLQYEKYHQDIGRSFTVSQRPDIVLRIVKSDLREKYVLTYLYDAKYRLQSDDRSDRPDFPTEDAINQMHRYRDAIYFVNKDNSKPEKEVIGAYVLFPGKGDPGQVESSSYFRSIADVNIGAFPLAPSDTALRSLLEKHLSAILESDTEQTLKELLPHKANTYEAPNPEVLIGIVPDETHAACFENSALPFYYTGKVKPNFFGYKSLRYFAPYRLGEGIREYYEILSYAISPRNEIFKPGHELYRDHDLSERLVVKLGKRTQIAQDGRPFKIADGTIRHFRYTNLSFIRNPRNNKIDVLRVG